MIGLSDADRQLWFRAYVHTAVTRDIVELTGARRSRRAASTAALGGGPHRGELVVQDLHRDVGFGSIGTTADYLSYLEMDPSRGPAGGLGPGRGPEGQRRPKST